MFTLLPWEVKIVDHVFQPIVNWLAGKCDQFQLAKYMLYLSMLYCLVNSLSDVKRYVTLNNGYGLTFETGYLLILTPYIFLSYIRMINRCQSKSHSGFRVITDKMFATRWFMYVIVLNNIFNFAISFWIYHVCKIADIMVFVFIGFYLSMIYFCACRHGRKQFSKAGVGFGLPQT